MGVPLPRLFCGALALTLTATNALGRNLQFDEAASSIPIAARSLPPAHLTHDHETREDGRFRVPFSSSNKQRRADRPPENPRARLFAEILDRGQGHIDNMENRCEPTDHLSRAELDAAGWRRISSVHENSAYLARYMDGWNGILGFPMYDHPVVVKPGNGWVSSEWSGNAEDSDDGPNFEFLVSQEHRAIVSIGDFISESDDELHPMWGDVAAAEYNSNNPPRWIVFQEVSAPYELMLQLGWTNQGDTGPIFPTQSNCVTYPLGSFNHQFIMGLAPSLHVGHFLSQRQNEWGLQTVASIFICNVSQRPNSPKAMITYTVRPVDQTLRGYQAENKEHTGHFRDREYWHRMTITKFAPVQPAEPAEPAHS